MQIGCALLDIAFLVGCNLNRFGRNGVPDGCRLGTIVRKLPSSTRDVPVVLLSDHHVYRRAEADVDVTIVGGKPENYSSGTPIVLCPQRGDQIEMAIDIVGRPFEHFKRLH